MKTLAPAAVKAALTALPLWRRKGAAITRRYEFADFVAAVKFVNAAAKHAEKARHHPDIDIRYNVVSLLLTTHDAGGLTEKDFALAEKLERAAEKVFQG